MDYGYRIALVAVITMMLSFSAVSIVSAAEKHEAVTIFAAASTTDVITEVSRLFQKENLGTVTTSFAASSTLAKQIENGAPADVFLSADQEWMDYLQQRHLIMPITRFNLLGNQLVLITPVNNAINKVDLKPGCDLAGLLNQGRMAMGDPEHVPAGLYGKAALTTLGIWPQVKDSIAAAASVRAALVLVEMGEAPLGIVYATDAAISKRIKIVGHFPEKSHPPITYPVAVLTGRESAETVRFMTFLRSDQAGKIFEKAGFTVLK